MEYNAVQINKLGASSSYKIKVLSVNYTTHWLTVSPEQMARIAQILTEPESEDISND